MHNTTVQQSLTAVSPNSNLTIVMFQAEAEFVSKYNVISFRCPCPPFIAPLEAKTPVVSNQRQLFYFGRIQKLSQKALDVFHEIQFSLWGGDAVFCNLDLRLDVLEQELQLPFTFVNGHIHELRIHIPWTKLGSEPVIITINTIECILKLSTENEDADTDRQKKKKFAASRGLKKPDISEAPPGYVQSKFKKDELRSIADELKLVVPDNAKVLDLRDENRRNEDENRRNENENRLEIEKIKLSQLEKELEIAKLHNQSGKSLPLQNENQLITTECNIEGAEIFYELLRPGQIYCGDSRLLLQNTVFGYVVSGSVGDELESIGVKNENCSEEDVSFEMFKQRVHFKNGRYEVELPWKRDSNELSDNFSLAKRRLGSLMRKMQRDKVLYSEYCKVLRNYLDEGIIEKVTNPFIPTNNPVVYLPHQVIIKNESLTTKLRLVFDASAHAEKQLSLNDCLFHGVNLNPNILDLLISFRSNKIAVLADVEKAFLQISLAPKDRDVVRFLIDDGENGVQVYRFNRVLLA
ncbi:vacuolar protein sorting-associated protein 13B [Trichonephila clavipes]|nr:vacuolar protein sorting-associated protein 13B [Trichonephila clavipes]